MPSQTGAATVAAVSPADDYQLFALQWGGRILTLGGTSESEGCALAESKHVTQNPRECASSDPA